MKEIKRRQAERELFLTALGSGTIIISNPETYPILKIGSTGASVKELQQKLKGKGYLLNCDGIFGAKTLAAVKAFQEAKGLVTDGIVGTETWGKLLK